MYKHSTAPHASVWVGTTALFALGGLIDGLESAAVSSMPSGIGAAIAAVALSVGLWTLLGVSFGALWVVSWRLLSPGAGWYGVVSAAWGAAGRFVIERGTKSDRVRISNVLAFCVSLAIWIAASFVVLVQLIENRHGAILIAGTFLVAQCAVIAGAIGLGVVTRRAANFVLTLPLFERPAMRRLVSLPTLAVFGALALSIEAALVIATQRQLVDSLDAATWAGLCAASLAAVVVGPAIGGRLGRPRAAIAIASLIAVVLVFGGARVGAARQRVVIDGGASRLMLSAVQEASDFDGDHAPFLPTFEDCAPFDAAIGPLELETAGDGVDTNCDGNDDPPDALAFDWPARGDVELPAGSPDLVLITIDSWRSDSTGFNGGDHEATPNLDAFAGEGVVFENAWSQDSGTGPSLWSLMAGKTPFQTQLESSGRFPPSYLAGEHTLAEALQDAGYVTAARVCGAMFAKKHWNISRGFSDFREICGKKRDPVAAFTVAEALKTLRSLRKKKPLFLWIHLFDPHRPYTDHKEQTRGTTPWDLYLEEVEYTDASLAPLLAELKKSRRRTYVAITADHGENFGDHGKDAHARTLYREVTHVPLVFWGSDVSPARYSTPVAVNDVHPTFLELAHASTDRSTMTSQARVLFGATPSPERLVFQENSFSRPRRHVKGLVGLGHHMLYDLSNDTWELYNLKADRAEKHNLVSQGLPVQKVLREAMLGFVQTTSIPKKLAR